MDLLQADASVEVVAAKAVDAAKESLKTAPKDPLFLAVVDLLARLPQEARGPGCHEAMSARGVSELDSVPGVLSGIADAIDDESLRLGFRSDLGEIGQTALLTSLSEALDQSLPSLFEPTPVEIRRALGQLSSGSGFARFARGFFARVVNQTLQYYLSRELSNHVGPGQRFGSDADRVAFDRALEGHAFESARIVEAYAGGWYGKTVWQGDGLTPDSIRRFTDYSMRKLRGELARQSDAA